MKRQSLNRREAAQVQGQLAGTAPPPDPDTLKRIYSTSLDLFQTQQITVENAFQIRFLDLMSDILELPDFNKNDMLGAGKIIETAGKIYTCRVEKTRSTVLDLASNLNRQQKKRKRDGSGSEAGSGNENDPHHLDDEGAGPAEDGEEGEGAGRRKKEKKKTKSRNNKFITDDNSKLSLPMDVDSFKGGARRTALEVKFRDFIDNDLDFDYYNEYLVRTKVDARPPSIEEQQNCFGNAKFPVPATVIDFDSITNLEPLKFVLMENYDKAVYNVWGRSLNEVSGLESVNQPHFETPLPAEDGDGQLNASNEHLFVPPVENDNGFEDNGGMYEAIDMDNEPGFQNDTFVEDDGVALTQRPAVNTKKFSSIQQFFELYSKTKASCNWAGPVFLKTQRLVIGNNGVRRPRNKRATVFVNVRGANKKEPSNRFMGNKIAKGLHDEETIECWSVGAELPHPFDDVDEFDDDYEQILALLTISEERKPSIPTAFKFFLHFREHLLGNLAEPDVIVKEEDYFANVANHVEDDFINEAGFDVEVERQHDYMQDAPMDFHSHIVEAEGEHGDASFTFPVSFGELLMENTSEKSTESMDSIKFTRKPKPIDMHGLKRTLFKYLQELLQFERGGAARLDEETSTDLWNLVKHVFRTLDRRTSEHMSLSIIIVGLLHVVVDNKLFFDKNLLEPLNPAIVCRGRLWDHLANVPMPEDED